MQIGPAPMLEHNPDHPLVVCFAGYIGAGKDTCAGFLKQFVANFIYDQDDPKWRMDLKPTSFAKPVKDLLRYVYDLSENDVYGHEDRAARERPHPNLAGKSPREAMQKIATEGFRWLIDNDTWVAHWYRNEYLQAVEDMATSHLVNDARCPIVLHVTDFRFVNEYEFMAKHCPNLIIYFVDRHPKSGWQKFIDRWDRWNLTGRRSHESELQIDQFLRDYPNAYTVIDNRPQPWNGGTPPSELQKQSLERLKNTCHDAFMEDFQWRFVK